MTKDMEEQNRELEPSSIASHVIAHMSPMHSSRFEGQSVHEFSERLKELVATHDEDRKEIDILTANLASKTAELASLQAELRLKTITLSETERVLKNKTLLIESLQGDLEDARANLDELELELTNLKCSLTFYQSTQELEKREIEHHRVEQFETIIREPENNIDANHVLELPSSSQRLSSTVPAMTGLQSTSPRIHARYVQTAKWDGTSIAQTQALQNRSIECQTDDHLTSLWLKKEIEEMQLEGKTKQTLFDRFAMLLPAHSPSPVAVSRRKRGFSGARIKKSMPSSPRRLAWQSSVSDDERNSQALQVPANVCEHPDTTYLSDTASDAKIDWAGDWRMRVDSEYSDSSPRSWETPHLIPEQEIEPFPTTHSETSKRPATQVLTRNNSFDSYFTQYSPWIGNGSGKELRKRSPQTELRRAIMRKKAAVIRSKGWKEESKQLYSEEELHRLREDLAAKAKEDMVALENDLLDCTYEMERALELEIQHAQNLQVENSDLQFQAEQHRQATQESVLQAKEARERTAQIARLLETAMADLGAVREECDGLKGERDALNLTISENHAEHFLEREALKANLSQMLIERDGHLLEMRNLADRLEKTEGESRRSCDFWRWERDGMLRQLLEQTEALLCHVLSVEFSLLNLQSSLLDAKAKRPNCISQEPQSNPTCPQSLHFQGNIKQNILASRMPPKNMDPSTKQTVPGVLPSIFENILITGLRGLEIERFRDRFGQRLSESSSAHANDMSQIEDELDEMLTLATASIRLHDECSEEIKRLQKLLNISSESPEASIDKTEKTKSVPIDSSKTTRKSLTKPNVQGPGAASENMSSKEESVVEFCNIENIENYPKTSDRSRNGVCNDVRVRSVSSSSTISSRSVSSMNSSSGRSISSVKADDAGTVSIFNGGSTPSASPASCIPCHLQFPIRVEVKIVKLEIQVDINSGASIQVAVAASCPESIRQSSFGLIHRSANLNRTLVRWENETFSFRLDRASLITPTYAVPTEN